MVSPCDRRLLQRRRAGLDRHCSESDNIILFHWTGLLIPVQDVFMSANKRVLSVAKWDEVVDIIRETA